jgi:hypothetical protein
MWKTERNTNIPDVSEEEALVTIRNEVVMRPEQKELREMDKEIVKATKPSLSLLRAVQLNDTARSREQVFRCVMCIHNLPILAFDETIQHIEMASSDDKQASWKS